MSLFNFEITSGHGRTEKQMTEKISEKAPVLWGHAARTHLILSLISSTKRQLQSLICSRGPAFVSNHRQWAEKSLVNMRYAAEPDNIKALY